MFLNQTITCRDDWYGSWFSVDVFAFQFYHRKHQSIKENFSYP